MIRIVYAMMTGGVTYQELKKATACKNTLVPQTNQLAWLIFSLLAFKRR
ncbi:hypothetical protein FAM18119_01954 [Lacticaseibacillus paracasei]|nr:hypothetical protein FAM18119_01954 [Lacticaseibacillus paracasei]VTZ84184.1 hypothetical protein LPCP272_02152 [Lacticaseibacillus paracasei]